MDVKQYVIDYIEGRVQPEEFNQRCETDPRIFEWIQTLVPNNLMHTTSTVQYKKNGERIIKDKIVPYKIENIYLEYMLDNTKLRFVRNLNLHGLIYKLVKDAFPNDVIVYDETLSKKFNYLLVVCPTYIGGKKAEELIEKIIEDNPKSSKKDVKNIIKQAFHIEGNKYPRWAQEPEWPFSDTGKPMKYISQRKVNSEVIELTFEDIDTGERKVVTDIY